jgi:hypothetical protein
MKITTESGSIYDIDSHGICRKFNKTGDCIDSFKVFVIKPVTVSDKNIKTWDDLRALPEGNLEVGKRLYIGGRDTWWISTPIVSIEESIYGEINE